LVRRLPLSASSEELWKLTEYERHFNSIQVGIRGLASVWLLAAFGAITTLLNQQESASLLLPLEWVICLVSVMGAIGLVLLWIIDQLVYHRLLNAIVLVGIRLEHDDATLPPVHSAMYSFMPRKGFGYYLSLFYIGPSVALSAIALSAAGYEASQGFSAEAIGLIALAAVPAALAGFVSTRSDDEKQIFLEWAFRLGPESFSKLFAANPDEFTRLLETKDLTAMDVAILRRFAFVPDSGTQTAKATSAAGRSSELTTDDGLDARITTRPAQSDAPQR
jgi:hypothetical protein